MINIYVNIALRLQLEPTWMFPIPEASAVVMVMLESELKIK